MNSRSLLGRMRRACLRGAGGHRQSKARWHRRENRPRRGPGAVRNQSGLTIVEVVISVIILGIVVTPVFDAFVRGRVLVAHRGEERIALRLIERKAEQLLDASYTSSGSDADITSTNLTAGTHPVNPTILLITRGDSDTSNDVYGDLTWTVTPITWTDPFSGYDDTDYKHVAITLAWPTGAHRDSVTITTVCG